MFWISFLFISFPSFFLSFILSRFRNGRFSRGHVVLIFILSCLSLYLFLTLSVVLFPSQLTFLYNFIQVLGEYSRKISFHGHTLGANLSDPYPIAINCQWFMPFHSPRFFQSSNHSRGIITTHNTILLRLIHISGTFSASFQDTVDRRRAETRAHVPSPDESWRVTEPSLTTCGDTGLSLSRCRSITSRLNSTCLQLQITHA